jgi:hypothetical protein
MPDEAPGRFKKAVDGFLILLFWLFVVFVAFLVFGAFREHMAAKRERAVYESLADVALRHEMRLSEISAALGGARWSDTTSAMDGGAYFDHQPIRGYIQDQRTVEWLEGMVSAELFYPLGEAILPSATPISISVQTPFKGTLDGIRIEAGSSRKQVDIDSDWSITQVTSGDTTTLRASNRHYRITFK